jgi:hypothetical protein
MKCKSRNPRPTFHKCLLPFSNNLARVFILAHGDELDVPDMVRIRPFNEVESGNQFGPYPNAVAHLLRRQTLSPTTAPSLWKIHERADGCNERVSGVSLARYPIAALLVTFCASVSASVPRES